MRKLFFILGFLTSLNSYSQTTEKIYYKDIVGNCIEDLNKQINQAWKDKENKKAIKLFDSLVNNCIKGKYLSNYDFKTIKNKTISTGKINTPIVLLTSANWCGPCWGEIPTLNKLAQKYDGQIEFIVLFWNKKKDLRKMASKYDKRIHLIPSKTEPLDKSSILINGFNHKLDYPAAYLIDEHKKILDMTRGAAFPNKNMGWGKVNKINEKKLTEFIKPVTKNFISVIQK
ncbi:TlpA family protein disulfide reductase [Tenacibaculum sp.]|uniref:TlpA family protein disulfide reductase n=1 Tax=Tenacibaculum sp. TaxID=1906242 RepID=UPI003AA9CD62